MASSSIEQVFHFKIDEKFWLEIICGSDCKPLNKNFFVGKENKGAKVLDKIGIVIGIKVNNSDVKTWLFKMINEGKQIEGLTEESLKRIKE